MKKIYFLILVGCFVLTGSLAAQGNDSTWKKLNDLTGDWIASGEGQPGQGSGSFSFQYDLNNKIIKRKSSSEYPASGNKPAVFHEDLMIIYAGDSNEPNAIYFDSEGHTINYKITFPDRSIQFLSNAHGNTPGFRLTYLFDDDKNKMVVNFEIASPQTPANFKSYVKGVAQRKK